MKVDIIRTLCVKVLRLIYAISGNTKCIDFMRKYLYINRTDELSKGIIVFDENKNEFTALNMCYINDMLGKAAMAEMWGCTPVFETTYIGQRRKIYPDFFECRELVGIELFKEKRFAKSKKDINGPDFDVIHNIDEVRKWHVLWKKYFPFNKKTICYLEDEKKKIFSSNSNILGISVRGTDYITLEPSGHPRQPNIQEVLEDCEEMSKNYDYIYVCCEEKRVIDLFVDKWGDKVLIQNRAYYDVFYEREDATHITQICFDREDDIWLRGVEYLASVYLLACCDGILGGNCGATRMAMIMKGGEYNQIKIYDKGKYS